MYRASIERARARRVWQAHIDLIHGGDHDTGCICDRQINRFRKGQRQGGCNRPRCYLCHGEKLFKRPTIKDLAELDRYKDSLLDYYDME